MTHLTYINYLNLTGFIINVLGTFLVTPLFNLPDNAAISEKFQTLVTPSNFTFAIWGIIFASQFIFTIAQLLPQYSDAPIIQMGVKHNYFYACVAQATWQFAFGYQIMLLAAVVMILILIPLYVIVYVQMKIRVSIGQFWLFKFPFQIHCGWIMAASMLNLNLVVVYFGSNAIFQLSSALISLALIIYTAMIFIRNRIYGSMYTIPIVFAWALFGISVELKNPKSLILDTFNTGEVYAVRILSECLAAIILCAIAYYATILNDRQLSERAYIGGNITGEATPLVLVA